MALFYNMDKLVHSMSTLGIDDILKRLPHRYPFLLVDRVLESDEKSLTALKNVTINEPFFVGHFPRKPVMPGVLITEALAQASGLLVMTSDPDFQDHDALYFLAGMEKVRFKKPVQPGDQLHLVTQLERSKRGLAKFTTEARVDGAVVTSCELMIARVK